MKELMIGAILAGAKVRIISPPWQLIGFVILVLCILICYVKIYAKLEKIEKQLKGEDSDLQNKTLKK